MSRLERPDLDRLARVRLRPSGPIAFDSPGMYEVDAVYELHPTKIERPFQGGTPCSERAKSVIDSLRGHVQVIVQ